jgi:hypothetical protein
MISVGLNFVERFESLRELISYNLRPRIKLREGDKVQSVGRDDGALKLSKGDRAKVQKSH